MATSKTQTQCALFLIIICSFIILGLVFIYSSSSVYALEKFGSAHYFVKKQLIACLLGCISLVFFRFFPLRYCKKLAPYAFYSTLILTALTLVPMFSRTVHGSQRWLKLYSISFQPSELLKIATLVYLAYLLDKKQYTLSSFAYGYLPLLCVLVAPALILLRQPDFGQTVTLCVTSFMLFFLAQCQTKHLLSTLGTLIPLGIALIAYKPYRLKRITTFLNPWADPQGAGFQIIQSLIAIGSGHITGVGIAHSKQKFFYLPMQHTDFIFSIIAEETGFLGSCTLILLYSAFLYYGLKLAATLKEHDQFSFYCITGFVLLTSLQAAINISVATGLMPTKGLGLPFISYGNTALICNLAMVGLILNCVYQSRTSTAGYTSEPYRHT